MERSKKIILGVDIGGSKIRTTTGRKFLEFRTPKKKNEFIKILKKFPKADVVGIGVAGIISGTKVKKSPNIKYLRNFDFRKIFPHVRVDNDARFNLALRLKKFGKKKILLFTIGTGIGRAYAEMGEVKKIKKLEYPESWEKEYQKIRDGRDDKKLAEFLGEKLSILIKRYNPEAVILGGGVLGRRGFYGMLKKKLKACLPASR